MSGTTLTPIEAEAPYFRLRQTGRSHRVREVVRVTWGRGGEHTTVGFRCGNMGLLERGDFRASVPDDEVLCDRCAQPPGPGRGRGRPR